MGFTETDGGRVIVPGNNHDTKYAALLLDESVNSGIVAVAA